MRKAFFYVLFLLFAPALKAMTLPGPLVEADWLKQQVADSAVLVLDIQEQALFQRHHIPGAVNWPYSKWRSGADGLPPKSMFPVDVLAQRLGAAGISEKTPVVIVATGVSPGDLSASARVFWNLKVLGHQQVAILNGGLLAYVNEHGGKYVSGKAEARTRAVYKAQPNLQLLATAEWLKDAEVPRLDARTLEEHVGLVTGPGERPGTLPGSKHLPYDWLTRDNTGRLRSTDQLNKLFDYAGLGEQGAVHFCHTGNRASLTWFVDYAIRGNEDARLYDASMLEWGKDKQLPIELSLPL